MHPDERPSKIEIVSRIQNDHEICFVGNEAYRTLSPIDPKGYELLQEAIKNDGSIKQ